METTTSELSLRQRLLADTPVFFKKVELLGLATLGVAGSLTQVAGLPAYLVPILLGIGTSLTLISKFAVKDTSVLANPNATIQDYSAVLADLPNQFEQLHAGIANTVAAIKTGQVAAAVPAAETPIVKTTIPEVKTAGVEPPAQVVAPPVPAMIAPQPPAPVIAAQDTSSPITQ